MAFTHVSRGLKRSALTVALGLCFAGGVHAQSTSGDIVGSVPTASGAKVVLKSTATGVTREYQVDASGRFRMSSLPTGSYVLTLPDGTTTRVNVVAGQTVTADFAKPAVNDASTLDTVTVIGSSPNTIDLQSTETRTTFVADQLNTLPVARDVTSVSLLTPGTASSSDYFGNASFGGATAAENSYYVNGFNVTNLYDNLSFTEVPFQAIGQLDVQTGGYGARYGFSTGGVTSVNVKRGTNDFEGGISYTWVPSGLREQPDPVVLKDGTIYRTYEQNSSSSSNLSVWAGGPLIKDKLFFFALGSISDSDSTSYGARGTGYVTSPGRPYTSRVSSSYDYSSTQPYWLLKLDWYLNDSNHLEYTGFDNSRKSRYENYDATYDSTGLDAAVSRDDYTGKSISENGGRTDVLKWTSYLTDSLTMSLQYGRMDNTNSDSTINAAGATNRYFGDVDTPPTCPYVLDYRPTSDTYGQQIGCATDSSIGISGGYNQRHAARADFEWQVGSHRLGAGLSEEIWKSRQGSVQDIYYVTDSSFWGYDDAELPVYERIYFATGGNVEVDQLSWYVEDNWNVTDNLMLYMGIRNDKFNNKNTNGETFVEQDNIWQPRLGLTWDVFGDGNSKLFATVGRYSLPIAANVSLRAASRSFYTDYVYGYDGTLDPVTGVPNGLYTYADGAFNQVYNGEDGSVPDPRAVAGQDLQPYTQDEAILGFQRLIRSDNSLMDGWQLGIKGTYRRVVHAIDDTCDARALYNAATAAGYDLSNWADQWTAPGGIPGCFMYNPGDDLTITTDVNVDGNIRTITIPADALGPKAKRNYRAVTLSADKFAADWQISASYTWSKLTGNLEGLVKSTNGQDDTGTTSDFDFEELMYGADGYLFNDHRHSFKLYGGYKFSPQWEVGFNLLAQSGSPVSCLGGGYGSFGTQYGYRGVFHVCDPGTNLNGANREADDVPSPVGSYGRTPWNITFSPNVIYRPTWMKGLSMQASVINLFNRVVATQDYETNFSYGVGTYREYYNFGQPKFFNTPRYVRFQVQYDF